MGERNRHRHYSYYNVFRIKLEPLATFLPTQRQLSSGDLGIESYHTGEHSLTFSPLQLAA